MSLYLRNKIWWIYLVNEHGKAVRRTTRTSDKKLAQQAHDALKKQLILNPRRFTRKNATLKHAIDLWLEYATYKATYDRDKQVLRFFEQRLGNMNLADLKAWHIQEVLREKSNFKPALARTRLT